MVTAEVSQTLEHGVVFENFNRLGIVVYYLEHGVVTGVVLLHYVHVGEVEQLCELVLKQAQIEVIKISVWVEF